MIYIPYVILNFIFSVICYLVNPFVILFTKEDGNLPYYLRWFQTHDHVLFFSDNEIAKMWPMLVNIETAWIKLYLCRLFWLYRNTGYTFSYEVCGAPLDKGWKIVNNTKECYFSYEQFVPFYRCKWSFKMEYTWSKYFFLDVYLGWKQKTMQIDGRTMIAMRINPFKGVN